MAASTLHPPRAAAVEHYRSDDDPHDALTPSSTPISGSGIITPRPDPSDKRLPGIKPAELGQATPPHTPRTSSNEESLLRSALIAPTSNPSRLTRGLSPVLPAHSASDCPIGGTSIGPSAVASVDPPRGKLSVKVLQARGLRPSSEPYVVCVCEWNESISKSTRVNGAAAGLGREGDGATRSANGLGCLPVRRSGGDCSGPVAIPMQSRQNSNNSQRDSVESRESRTVTHPRWDHQVTFDVVGDQADLEVFVYDRSEHETFLGRVRVRLSSEERGRLVDGWYPLEARVPGQAAVEGEIQLRLRFQTTDKKHYGPEDFEVLKLIGKGTFGQVYQVRKRDTHRIYAMKVLSKKVIVQKKEVAHTVGERNILVRTAMADSPFIVGLKFSFQTPTDLYLVTDYMSGGELFWHLQKEGRFNETRAKFYIAELILALQHLHRYDIVYRDLKPENILLDANGHVALCDFGLSKANLTKDDTTNTFCGTTEYLAPEVLLDEKGYTKMVDFWSLGVLVFEMCCGWSPFYADDTQQMYKNIAFGKVRFPRDALSTEGRNFVKGLLNRNPRHRLGAVHDAEELKAHPFFADVDWQALTRKDVVPPFKPKLKSPLDTSNFDPEFTNALQGTSALNSQAAALASHAAPASTPLSPGVQAKFKGFTFVDESMLDDAYHGRERDELERMDEDEAEAEAEAAHEAAHAHDDAHDAAWAHASPANRMSGIVHTGSGGSGSGGDHHAGVGVGVGGGAADDGVFNHGTFDP
ncbi:MAG: hypothetical protein M1826_004833 [Phylliscum demangeonii]|nr:MAG: hypothetical protein M1826_004833 [Phylliscum demangeonii]